MSQKSQNENSTNHRKNRKVVKISGTMIRRLSLVTIFCNLLLFFVVSHASTTAIKDKEVSYFSEILSNISNTVETTLAGYTKVSSTVAVNPDVISILEKATANSPMASQSNASSVTAFLASVQRQHSNVINVGICDMEQNAYFLHDGTTSGSNWSFPTRSYYAVTQTKQNMITAPYVDNATGGLVVTIASPVISSSGVVLGCAFVDISMDFVVAMVGSAGFGETGKTLIADSSGNLIACMDYEFIGTSYSNLGVSGTDLEREMANPTGAIIELHTNGNMSYGTVGGIAGTDWAVVTSVEIAEFNQTPNQVQMILCVMLVVCISVTLIVAVVTVQSSIKPIELLREAMSELSMGNTKYQFDYQSDNEIGALAEDLRFTTKNLSDYIDEINRQLESCSRGDFTIQSHMEFLGDFAAIQTSIRNFTSLISEALEGMKQTVEQVSVGSDYVATGSQNLAEGSNRQSDSVRILNKRISDITLSVTENVKNVQQVNESSTQATNQLKINNDKMNEMVHSMEEINRTSEGIQKIVKTIEDVAFQTNILALNAAVEAARAGSAGKGFAVVAEEVRNLSSRTSEAVQETSRLIDETVSAVKTGTDIVDETAKGLNEAIGYVESFMDSLGDITLASEHQAKAIEEINQGVADISSVMQTNSAISEESAATSEELSSQASVMKETISQFITKK